MSRPAKALSLLIKAPGSCRGLFRVARSYNGYRQDFRHDAFEAYKVITTQPDVGPSTATTWQLVLVDQATGNCVTPAQLKRR